MRGIVRRRNGSLNTTSLEIASHVVVRWFGGESWRHAKAYRWDGFVFLEVGRLGIQFGRDVT